MSLIKRFTTKNVGNFDRIIRLLPLAVFLYVWQTGALGGVALWALGIISVMLALTSLTARCSIYAILGLSTCPLNAKANNDG